MGEIWITIYLRSFNCSSETKISRYFYHKIPKMKPFMEKFCFREPWAAFILIFFCLPAIHIIRKCNTAIDTSKWWAGNQIIVLKTYTDERSKMSKKIEILIQIQISWLTAIKRSKSISQGLLSIVLYIDKSHSEE